MKRILMMAMVAVFAGSFAFAQDTKDNEEHTDKVNSMTGTETKTDTKEMKDEAGNKKTAKSKTKIKSNGKKTKKTEVKEESPAHE